jgi:hypothetical protein
MSLVLLCSASGAPGVTTAGLALTWTWSQGLPGRRALLVDADPTGSRLQPGFLEAGIPAGGGILGAAAERGISLDVMLHHAVSLDQGETRLVLTGVAESAQARPLASTWAGLVDVARDAGAVGLDVLVDAGRLGHRWEPTPLLEAADVAVVVTRSSLAAVAVARSALNTLRAARSPGARTTVLIVGPPDPYSPAEVAKALSVEPLPSLALDTWAAQSLAAGGNAGWRFTRSPLLRSAGDVVTALSASLDALTAQPRVGAS